MAEEVLQNFQCKIIAPVYDVVDLATRIPLEKQAELERLNREISGLRAQLEHVHARFAHAVEVEQVPAELSFEDATRAQFLANCLAICPRMTACQLNADGRLMCGGVALTKDDIQANWDLVDTCVGADA